jgi:hypothetical protein
MTNPNRRTTHMKNDATQADTKVTPMPRHPSTMPPYAAREFLFADGRPILIVNHCVQFCCPAKDAPETQTLVSVKGGKPVPLKIPYAEFKAWLMGGGD